MSGENVRFLVNRLTGTFYPEQFGNPGRTTFVRDSDQTSVYSVQVSSNLPDSITGPYYSFKLYPIKLNTINVGIIVY